MDIQKIDQSDLGGSSHVSRSGPINNLATELLVLILEFVAEDRRYRYDHCVSRYHRGTLRTLMLVCRRFRNIAQDFAFHTLKLNWEQGKVLKIIDFGSWDHRAHFYRSPSVCRQLVITWSHSQMGAHWFRKLEKTKKLVDTMSGVRCFQFEETRTNVELPPPWREVSVYIDQHTAAWDVFTYTVQKFDRLRHLIIKRAYLSTLVKACRDLPNLRTLDLIEVQERDDQTFQLDPEDRMIASFTTLRLFNFLSNSASLRQLLEWPRALETLVWGNPRYNLSIQPRDEGMWSILVLDHASEPQKDTLKLIQMGHYNFHHEGPALESWILPRVELFEYMLAPLKKGHTWCYGDESTFHFYMKKFSEEGKYITPVTTEKATTSENKEDCSLVEDALVTSGI